MDMYMCSVLTLIVCDFSRSTTGWTVRRKTSWTCSLCTPPRRFRYSPAVRNCFPSFYLVFHLCVESDLLMIALDLEPLEVYANILQN